MLKELAPTFSPQGGAGVYTPRVLEPLRGPAAMPPPFRSMRFKYPLISQGNSTVVTWKRQGML